MPEGDSLHRAAQTLQVLVGERVAVETPNPRAAAAVSAATLDGRRLESVEAIDKNLLLRFEGGLVLRSHLRMTGRWQVVERFSEATLVRLAPRPGGRIRSGCTSPPWAIPSWATRCTAGGARAGRLRPSRLARGRPSTRRSCASRTPRRATSSWCMRHCRPTSKRCLQACDAMRASP